mgnify:CR=1 FL=1
MKIKEGEWLSFDIETTSVQPMSCDIVGFSFSNNIFISASPGHAQSGVQQRGGWEAAEDDGGLPANPEVIEAGAADFESGGAPEVSQSQGL